MSLEFAPIRLFAYGTLLDKDIQRNVIGRCLQGSVDTLHDYKKILRTFNCGTYPDLLYEKGSSVTGMVFDLTEDEVDCCDRYEGDEYFKMNIVLASGVHAVVYKGI